MRNHAKRVSGEKCILNRIRSTVSWQGIPLENVKIERGWIYQVGILAAIFFVTIFLEK